MDTSRFDNIRPYTDAEIPATMERIARSEMFPLIASYVFPDEDTESVRRRVLSIKSIADFQRMVMVPVNERIIERSISHFSYSGLEQLSRDKSYLFVSNHRDIMLDASLLQHILHLNGYETSEITFGANLMSLPLLIDIGRANKMFRVERGGSFKDFYRSSLLLSDYIRHTITERHSSVWIAQRNGRTKDGIDRTEPGLISMFAGSMPSDKIEALDSLRIVPVAVSYEWETCDVAKALELYESRFTRYVKKPGRRPQQHHLRHRGPERSGEHRHLRTSATRGTGAVQESYPRRICKGSGRPHRQSHQQRLPSLPQQLYSSRYALRHKKVLRPLYSGTERTLPRASALTGSISGKRA